MLNNGIEAVHFEPTARCNAKCPMCSRTGNDQILSNQGEVSYDQFVQYFPEDFVKGLKKFKFCGNYGDPAIAKDLVKIHEYLFTLNPSIEFILSTNGGIRGEKFWQSLAKYYPADGISHVQFHIDGLEDTNHIYRVGVKWSRLIRNVKAFNDAGGKSGWFFIPFFHNEHQIEKAEELSKELGCQEFVIKVSARFKEGNKPFMHSNGKLYPPTSDRFRFEKFQKEGKLQCVAELRKEIYVDAWSRLWPCCWTASAYHKNMSWPMWKDPSINSLKEKSIEEILSSSEMNEWIQSQYANIASVCNARCTGKYIHIIDRQGVQKPQKEYW
jgi:MoaA/NifB/PqqE/SkfB family radical SAM enzyme